MLTTAVKYINPAVFRRQWRGVTKSLFKNKIIFVHVPKCGGTSLSQMLRAKYPFTHYVIRDEESSRVFDAGSRGRWMEFKMHMLAYYAEREFNFIKGHVPVSREIIDRYSGRYKFITVLRHPVDRIISMYYFDARCNKLPFSEFLKSERGRIESRILSHFFGELSWEDLCDGAAAPQRAIDNLKRFSVVGVLENPQELSKQCRDALGFDVPLPRRNVGENRKSVGKEISDSDREDVYKACAEDILIYEEFARKSRGDVDRDM